MASVSDLDNLEFNIKKEQWNEYELKDGTKIKARIFLTRMDENKNIQHESSASKGVTGQYSISVQNNFQVFALPHKKGNPTLPLPNVNEIKEDQKEEAEILTSSEPWNIYEILKNGMIVRIKLVLSDVFRVKDCYDQFGEPYFIIKSGPVFDYKIPDRPERFA